jgi:hypothetical protein
MKTFIASLFIAQFFFAAFGFLLGRVRHSQVPMARALYFHRARNFNLK